MSTITAPANPTAGTSVGSVDKVRFAKWPLFGVAAGVLGYAATVLTRTVSEAALQGGVEPVYNELSEGRIQVRIGASLGFLTIALIVAFGLGLRRHLADRLPESSNIPGAISAVLGGAVGMMVIAFGFKAMLAGGMPGGIDTALYTHTDVAVLQLIVGQTQWLAWMGVALMMAPVAVAAFRYRVVSRWLGAVSTLFTVFVAFMTLGLALPYSAGIVGGPWLVIAGLGLLRASRKAPAQA